jgi:protein-S-isoprenylcysteine O-methyltransferase Ste14
MVELALWIVVALFPTSEVVLAVVRRSRVERARSEDRGSWLVLWLSVAVGIGLAIAAQWVPSARLPGPAPVLRVLALVFLVGGLALRWVAIVTLGRLFTVDVAVHSSHAVVRSGPYRLVRHPAYTGLLLAFLGLGVFFANWLSIVALLVPIGLAVVNRVLKEERTLKEALGPEYTSYCARTKRFIPGVL